MMLCFIEPAEAIRVMAESMGREARRSLLAEVIEAWVDDIPEEELNQHYARAVDDLDHEDLSMLAAWHATLEIGTPVASAEFLVGVFDGLDVLLSGVDLVDLVLRAGDEKALAVRHARDREKHVAASDFTGSAEVARVGGHSPLSVVACGLAGST